MKAQFLLMLMILLSAQAQAKLIQVIHTNDLHSFFEGTNSGKGGYARLKTKIDQLRAQAKTRGIPSLYLDGGDFGEGSSFYASGKGEDSLRALDLLGVDATVLGNHDYILGGPELHQQMAKAQLKTPILSANLRGKIKLKLNQSIKAHLDFDLDGLKVRVMGLSTPEVHAQYVLKPLGKIIDPIKVGLKILKKSAMDKVDFVISLSHTGVDKDKKLIRQSTNLGLVVGGHDHLRFDQPRVETNANGAQVSILQAGAHSLAVGSVILDVGTDGMAKIIEYQLHDITPTVEKDSEMAHFVETAKQKREDFFQRSWDEIVAISEITLTGRIDGRMKQNRSCWSRHIAKMSRQAMNSKIGFQFDVFQSGEIPAGPITFGNIIDNFTHFDNWETKGWEISKMRLLGAEIKLLLKFVSKDRNEFSTTVDGISVREDDGTLVAYKTLIHKPWQALIDGAPIYNLKKYSIALPAEIPRALRRTVPVVGKLLFRTSKVQEKKYFWPVIEEYLRSNSPLKCLSDKVE